MEKILKNIESFLNEKKEKEKFKKVESFHGERIKKIENNKAPIALCEGAKIVLHLIPVNSFCSQKHFDLAHFHNRVLELKMLRDHAPSQTYNFDGLLHFQGDIESQSFGYVQLFSNGTIEGVGVYSPHPVPRTDMWNLPIYGIEKNITDKLNEYLVFQKEKLEVELPIVFYLSLIGIKDWLIFVQGEGVPDVVDNKHNFDTDTLDFPKILIDNFDVVPKEILKTTFDRLWNASGYPRSFHYDKDGNWVEK